MQISKTVVINCAGIGSRLGFGKTKALIEIGGKSIIARQLDMLTHIEDVRIVVGFQAEQVIEAVLAIRKDVIFVFNHDYHSTGTAHSFYLGSRHSNEWVISLDGDLLVHPHDFQRFIEQDQACLGFCEPITQEPVFVNIKNINNQPMVTDFSRESGQYEWTGLLQINAQDIKTFTRTHIYLACEGKLPLPGMLVNAREIDTPDDFDQAVNWINEIEKETLIHDPVYIR